MATPASSPAGESGRGGAEHGSQGQERGQVPAGPEQEAKPKEKKPSAVRLEPKRRAGTRPVALVRSSHKGRRLEARVSKDEGGYRVKLSLVREHGGREVRQTLELSEAEHEELQQLSSAASQEMTLDREKEEGQELSH